jgi:hypothetical protein
MIMHTLILSLASATSSIDVGAEHELAEPRATSSSAVESGGPVTFLLKVAEKVGLSLGGAWLSPIQLTVAGDDLTITGGYWRLKSFARFRWYLLFILATFAVALAGGAVLGTATDGSTGADVGAAVFVCGILLALAAAAKLAVRSVRLRRKARQTPQVHVFSASAVTLVKLERYGSRVLLGFLLIFGAILPGWLLWRLFSPVRGLRITAPWNPDKPSPETYLLVARDKDEAAALAQALRDSGASTPS